MQKKLSAKFNLYHYGYFSDLLEGVQNTEYYIASELAQTSQTFLTGRKRKYKRTTREIRKPAVIIRFVKDINQLDVSTISPENASPMRIRDTESMSSNVSLKSSIFSPFADTTEAEILETAITNNDDETITRIDLINQIDSITATSLFPSA